MASETPEVEQPEGQDADTAATVAAAAEGGQINVAGARPEISTAQGGEELKLVLGEFSGPLDLLLYLIRQEQVSIYDIPVARITTPTSVTANDAGHGHRRRHDFLVMAAQLIVSSRRCCSRQTPLCRRRTPRPTTRGATHRPAARTQKYKAAPRCCVAREPWSRPSTPRAIETDKTNPEVSVGAFDLLRVFQEILTRKKEEVLLEIERDEMTMTEMLERLRNMVFSTGELNLRQFFEHTRSRRELVLAFLSVLELVRTSEVRLFQSETFGDIVARVSS